jgi:alpha-tubulin suppressor-like RCC1 family protein
MAVDGLDGAAVTAVAAGKSHSAAVASSGEAWTWGEGREGKLGHGCTDNMFVPARCVWLWAMLPSCFCSQ